MGCVSSYASSTAPLDQPHLDRAAHRLYASAHSTSWDIRAASRFDAVLLNRDLLEGRVEYEQRLLRRNPRVLFDFDDAIFLGAKARHIQWICENAAWVTAGNDCLASFAQGFTDRVTVLPTVVDTGLYAVHTAAGKTIRVGWLGSDRSIRETLFPHVPMLASLQAELGFEFIVVSRPRRELPASGLRYQFVEWSPQTETRIADLIDIGIMPLVDDEFQRGKCGCKLLQYMAAGLPSIASPVGINSTIINCGQCGFLAVSGQEWRQALSRLIADANQRVQMGAAGRAFVEREYSVERWFPSLLGILKTSGLYANPDKPRWKQNRPHFSLLQIPPEILHEPPAR